MNQIKNIIFDVGEVLLEYRWRQVFYDFGVDKENAERMGTNIFDDADGLWHQFDMGTIEQEDLIAAYCKKYPDDVEAIDWFIRHAEYMPVPRPKVWKMVHRLKEKGYRLYILSNYSEILFKKHTQYADFIPEMDGIMVSYMINEAKPDRVIYKALCDKYHLKPEECIFFDDRAENVQGAIDYGMQSKQVLSQDEFLKDLQELLDK